MSVSVSISVAYAFQSSPAGQRFVQQGFAVQRFIEQGFVEHGFVQGLRRLWRGLCGGLAVLIWLALLSPAQANEPRPSDFSKYIESLWPKAEARDISRATFDKVTKGLRYNEKVIRLDRKNYEIEPDNTIPPFEPYRRRHVDAKRIAEGRKAYKRLQPFLKTIEQQSGVPGAVLIAIYGQETAYGSITGNFDIAESLATLAFEGRRRSLFEPELLAVMQMVESGIPRSVLVGSWAGALGYPQFLPSVYLRLARDGDGDGEARIWDSEADAIASIGHYLQQSGWQAGEGWGIAVSVPASFDRNRFAMRPPPQCSRVIGRHSRWRTIAEWRTDGLQLAEGESKNWLADSTLASLLEPDGEGETAYLLTKNYRALLDYNCSNFYGLSVGLLADAIASK